MLGFIMHGWILERLALQDRTLTLYAKVTKTWANRSLGAQNIDGFDQKGQVFTIYYRTNCD